MKEYGIHRCARVVVRESDDRPVAQVLIAGKWAGVDYDVEGLDVNTAAAFLAATFRIVVAAESGAESADPKESPSPRSKLADAAVDLRRATLAVKAAECQNPDPHYGPCSNCAACIEKARARGEKSSALSRLRYYADKVIAEGAP